MGCTPQTDGEEVSPDEVKERIEDEFAQAAQEFPGFPTTENRTIQAGGLTRSYIVTTPPGIHERQNIPLIFAFHGYRSNAETMRRATQFDRSSAVVVYLDGMGDAWAPAPYAQTTGEQDLAFYDAVRAQVLDQYPINPAKVYLAGMSNGGGFAAYTACHRAHEITGIATVSAAFYERVLGGCQSIPVKQIDLHGTHDDVISYNGGARHDAHYYSSQDIMNTAARRNHCEPNPITATIQNEGEEFVWTGCDAPLRHYRIDNGGHFWFGSTVDKGASPAPATGFASEQILDFFGISYRGDLGPEL